MIAARVPRRRAPFRFGGHLSGEPGAQTTKRQEVQLLGFTRDLAVGNVEGLQGSIDSLGLYARWEGAPNFLRASLVAGKTRTRI